MEIPVVVPSSGRADAILTCVSGMILYVDEREADAYRAAHPDVPIQTHRGLRNLAAIRQSIYTRWPRVFMIDDDIDRITRLYRPGNNRKDHLTPDQAHELIQVTGHAADRGGCVLWGFSNHPNAQHYYPHRPIALTQYINACAFGLHPSARLYFSDRTTAAESHWINLLNAATHRKSWCDTRFCFAQAAGSTFQRPGGQTAKRHLQSELADTLFLRRMFGQSVQVKRTRSDTLNQHPYQRAIDNRL